MNVLIVHAHPEPKSFNAALTEMARLTLVERGHDVAVSDLYASGWNPVSDRRNFTSVFDADFFKQQQEEMNASRVGGFAPDVRAELDKVFAADLLIFQFPLWWFGLPAILKGWVDRVFAMGEAYGEGRWYEDGVFRGKRAMLSLTTGGGPTAYSERGLMGSMHAMLFPIHYGVLRFTGFDVLPPHVSWSPSHVGDEGRRELLAVYRQRLQSIEQDVPIVYTPLSAYDPETFERVA